MQISRTDVRLAAACAAASVAFDELGLAAGRLSSGVRGKRDRTKDLAASAKRSKKAKHRAKVKARRAQGAANRRRSK